MTVQQLTWAGTRGTDVHGIAGVATRPLVGDVRYLVTDPATGATTWKDLTELRAVHPTAAPRFTARFRGALDAGGSRTGHGVKVDGASGMVTTLPGWPTTPELRTFLIEVTVTGAPGPYPPISIRVHLHQAIQNLWLTPDELIVRPGRTPTGGTPRQAPQRFTVMARFDDLTAGDVTEDLESWTQTGWSPVPTSMPNPGPLPINRAAGWVATDRTSGWWTVTLDLPALGTGSSKSASADVGADASWAEPREVTWVAGLGPDKRGEVPNALFVAEGFTDGSPGTTNERPNFDGYVQEVVRKLGTSLFRPFDKVSGAMNFWSVFVGSRSAGTTIYNEHSLATKSATSADASPVPAPVRPAAPLLGQFPVGHAGTWTLEEMIHEIGLPIPTYEGTAPTPAKRESDWQALYDPNLRQAQYMNVVDTKTLLARWQALGERAVLDQATTLFGLRHGEPSRMVVTSNSFPRSLWLDSNRATQADLDEFLDALTYKGVTIGNVLWGPGLPGSPGQPGSPAGKDRGLVCLLSRTRRFGGGENVDHFTTALGQDEVLPCAKDGPRWRIDPKPAPRAPFYLAMKTAQTVAHECGHAIGLGDEYGGNGTTPCPSTPVEVAKVNATGNLLHAVTVGAPPAISLTPAPTWPASTWPVWPRIAAAGITFAQMSAGDTDVMLEVGHSVGFEANDLVMLRTRDLLDPSGSGAGPTYSALLEVDSVDPVVDNVTFKSALTGSLDFPEGSVLIKPVLDASRNPLPLLSKIVKDHVETTDRPVNRAAGAPCAVPAPNGVVDEFGIIWAVNLPAHLLGPGSLHTPVERVVGLYDGGHIHNCGVYHPTGACLMRGYGFKFIGGASGSYPFCHVCRYVIADRLDPRAHAAIDSDYGNKYYPL